MLGYAISCIEGEKIFLETNNGSFTIEKNSDVKTVGGSTFKDFEPLKSVFSSNTHRICITEDNIAYIAIPTFSDWELKKEFYANLPLIKNCRGFIIDVRYNGGGSDSNSDAVAKVFIDGPLGGVYEKTPSHSACYKAHGQYRDIMKLDKSDPKQKKIYDVCTHGFFEYDKEPHKVDDCPMHLEQPVVILSDCNTACAAEFFLADFKFAKRAPIVGTYTFGSGGQPLEGSLPGGGSYGICSNHVYLWDDTDIINVGMKPDIFAELTIKDYKNGFDSVFDRGLKVVRELCEKN